MTSPGKTPYEIIHGRDGSSRSMRVPDWGRSNNAADPKHAESTDADSGAWRAWLVRPIRVRLNVGMVLALAGLFAACLVIAYELGRRGADLTGLAATRSTERMERLQTQQINTQLMRTDTSERDDDQPDADADADPARPAAAPGPDGRVPGLNYFCLETIPIAHRREGERAVAFLQRNGVDATLIPVNNTWLQLTALRGFAKPYGEQGARFKSLLQALGRMWKAKHQGWHDWHDVYPVKYAGDPVAAAGNG